MTKKSKKMWGGRFHQAADAAFWEFSKSLSYDRNLLRYDIESSLAHVKMLSKRNIIPKKDADMLVKSLESMLKDYNNGKLKINEKSEDVHTAVFLELLKRAKKSADYLHTARSRNDLVVSDLRLYVKDKVKQIIIALAGFQKVLVSFAKENVDVVMPGYTHMQHAVPVLISHQILAYVNMLERDKTRLNNAHNTADEMPLGSCAMAGTGLAIDRAYMAKLLNFSKISSNSIDAVSGRDFVLELLSAISITSVNLSRIAQDLIFFSCTDINFLNISEKYCTGSSIMPQKKNPDSLELIRGITSEINADLFSVFSLMKALPLSYNRDMQYDKKPVFKSVDNILYSIKILTGVFNELKVNKNAVEEALLRDDSIYALDIADYLVRKKVPFVQAHELVGKLVKYAEKNKTRLADIKIDELKKISKEFNEDVFSVFNPKRSVTLKKSMGSTNPLLVRQQIEKWHKKLKTEDKI